RPPPISPLFPYTTLFRSLDQLRILAVMADKRLEEYPDIPTAREAGIDWTAVGWRGLAAPRETPEPIRKQLEQVCARIAQSPEYRSEEHTSELQSRENLVC